MPAVDRPEPPYLQIAGSIRDDIVSGRLKEGDAVPSAREIARNWNVAMATAMKVLSTLRAEGLVRAVRGVGTVVQTRALHRSAQDRTISIARTGKVYPPGHYAKIREAGLLPAPDRVADALGIEEGAPAIRRRRTTYAGDEQPVSTSVSWFDGALAAKAPLLFETERIVEGTVKYVADRTGRVLSSTRTQHAAGLADAEDAAELGVPEGTAILLSRNRFLSAEGDVLEYGESAALPNHWVFYEYNIEDGA
ncbi:GntR family transcriptional regulator [Amycolatopsis orientalis]|uniref:GntR family transcriptional regulator n=1 Tax=Amycolatopsis orientalis TaxID=31958 RepID=A0A193C3P7_AMYOR|nr:GntR family transcriptional regulator [Amycolatopsis orientalis]ANN19102.1 GntR family transcriptional regulator [Amycolatopsis orientalis]